MSILDQWINPYYLEDETVEAIKQSIIAKPVVKYTVLDNFFKEDMLEKLIKHHSLLNFSEEADRRSPENGAWLPYDGAVVFAKKGLHFGSDLFYDDEWHRYLGYLSSTDLKYPCHSEIKLRYHRPEADGFWIHTDSVLRSMVAILYFNKEWKASDGGLLQLWRVDETLSPNAHVVEAPIGRMDCLTQHARIRTSTPGGGFPDKKPHDLVLIDQIVPAYNRLFICNFKHSMAYHSVTPSNGKPRLGFVQWLMDQKGG